MSREYKKCVIASSGLHVLLVLVVLVCPAFLASKPKQVDVQLLNFVPEILIAKNFANDGGQSGNQAPAPAPPHPAPPAPPTPAPPPQPTRQPEREVAPPQTSRESLEIAKPNAKKKMDLNLTPVVRNPNAKPAPKDTSASDKEAREAFVAQQQLLGRFDRSLNTLGRGNGPATTNYRPGTGSGPSYAGYGAWVWTFFHDAWVPPDDATSEDATAEISVTIARDGTVIAKRISKKSGEPALDASMQRLLDRISSVRRPFPEEMTEKQHSYTIPFNLKSNRGAA
jgi:outer membrane biosynthesis protein TonB